MESESCQNCRFYRVSDSYGHCHRYTPQLHVHRWEWPYVRPENWCGEFRPATPGIAAAAAACGSV